MIPPFTYIQKDFVSWLKKLAVHLQTTAPGNCLTLPPAVGKGTIFAMNQGRDISFVIMNFKLHQHLTLCRRPSSDYGILLFFNQTEVSDFFRLRSGNHAIEEDTKIRSNIFMSSTNMDLEIHYSKGSRLQRVGIYFSPAMVKKFLKEDMRMNLMVYTNDGIKNVNRETINFETKSLLDEIFQTRLEDDFGRLVLQNRVWMLAEKFFINLQAKQVKGAKTGKTNYTKTEDVVRIQTVEKVLTRSDIDKFPSIEALSKMAMMSSTKLKTKFKEVYGMKLYEYYNRNRLLKAREMISRGKTTIKEAAYSIGFSNLSNFSRAFKKEFGVLPGKMK
ncbi:MAG TPA: AraC family transcriptional regulator [Chitinophagaceae bacterium]